MSLKVSDFDNKILKTEKEIELLSEKINKKKKEISVLKKQRRIQELKERTKRNEQIVSALEEKIGGSVSEEMINRFVEFQKRNPESHNFYNNNFAKKRHPIRGAIIGYFVGGIIAIIPGQFSPALGWAIVILAVVIGIIKG